MWILDTDVLSFLLWASSTPRAQRLYQRLETGNESVTTTIVCCEEQLRGWMDSLAKKKTVKDQVEAYLRLRLQLEKYEGMKILDFDGPAATVFQDLKKGKVRLGTMDLKISAIALVHDATLLTGNVSDFRKVPGLKIENWYQV